MTTRDDDRESTGAATATAAAVGSAAADAVLYKKRDATNNRRATTARKVLLAAHTAERNAVRRRGPAGIVDRRWGKAYERVAETLGPDLWKDEVTRLVPKSESIYDEVSDITKHRTAQKAIVTASAKRGERVAAANRARLRRVTVNSGNELMKDIIDELYSTDKALDRVDRLAMEEVLDLASDAQDKAAREVPSRRLVKYWRTRGDSKVRKSHQKAGTNYPRRRPILHGDKYNIEGVKASRPRDGNLPPKNRKNCRCQNVYYQANAVTIARVLLRRRRRKGGNG